MSGLLRLNACLATRGEEAKSPHFVADLLAVLQKEFGEVKLDALSLQGGPLEFRIRVRGMVVHVRESLGEEDGASWFFASVDNRMVRFKALKAVKVPVFRDIGVASNLLRTWQDTWVTRILTQKELAHSESPWKLYVKRMHSSEPPEVAVVSGCFLSEKAFADAIRLLFTVF